MARAFSLIVCLASVLAAEACSHDEELDICGMQGDEISHAGRAILAWPIVLAALGRVSGYGTVALATVALFPSGAEGSTMTFNDPVSTTCRSLGKYYKAKMCCGQPDLEVDLPLPADQDVTLAASVTVFWTKEGLEQIPFAKWEHFSPNDAQYRPYVADIPWPGDNFTADHLELWREHVAEGGSEVSLASLLASGFVSAQPHAVDDVQSVPTLFSVPHKVEYTAIDYRLQYAADRMGMRDLGLSAMKGRLSNPSGRRLREHFYRFPDQCDATPIALEVFLRLILLDQVEVFFRPEPRVGLFQDLYADVPRRAFDPKDMSIARWYASRYAEGYMHSLENGGWVYPFSEQNIDTQMRAVGLDPTDKSMDVNTPVGLGNVVGSRATDWLMANDNLQKSMDWVDEEGLQAIDDYHMNNLTWSSWVPSLAGATRFQGIRPGIVTRQTFVSPSLGVFSFMYKDDEEFLALGFESSVPFFNQSDEAYLARSQDFMSAQMSLTDLQKAVAELANNKITGSVWMILAFVKVLKKVTAGMTHEEYLALYDDFSMVTSGCAEYGATHAAWRTKRTLFAGRPQTVIPRLAKMNAAFAEEFPHAVTWKPMIPAGDHPEFPSGSMVIYNGFIAAGDHWFAKHFPESYSMVDGSKASQDTGTLSLEFPAGAFYWTDGPAADVTVEYESLDAWAQELPMARMWAGVHFREAGEAGLLLGAKVGEACFNIQEMLKAGDMTATYTYSGRLSVSRFR